MELCVKTGKEFSPCPAFSKWSLELGSLQDCGRHGWDGSWGGLLPPITLSEAAREGSAVECGDQRRWALSKSEQMISQQTSYILLT